MTPTPYHLLVAHADDCFDRVRRWGPARLRAYLGMSISEPVACPRPFRCPKFTLQCAAVAKLLGLPPGPELSRVMSREATRRLRLYPTR